MSAVQLFRTLGQAVGLVIFGLFLYNDTDNVQYSLLLHESLKFIFLLVSGLAIMLSIYMIWFVYKENGEYRSIYEGRAVIASKEK